MLTFFIEQRSAHLVFLLTTYNSTFERLNDILQGHGR